MLIYTFNGILHFLSHCRPARAVMWQQCTLTAQSVPFYCPRIPSAPWGCCAWDSVKCWFDIQGKNADEARGWIEAWRKGPKGPMQPVSEAGSANPASSAESNGAAKGVEAGGAGKVH